MLSAYLKIYTFNERNNKIEKNKLNSFLKMYAICFNETDF